MIWLVKSLVITLYIQFISGKQLVIHTTYQQGIACF